ncbi:hypothetical protein IU433_12940 [Nocardia puris]|uniref:type VII secretion target n=1 Tax=Nocardia puris TaxID=208602 RepID=UPI001892F2DF|nr:type VII secretion target [Nocardia puris]MBF6213592.1 hypothetical protein [Nocardia puris]MBF6365478.1 hypothetical protein [Nocardia puris]MBF6459944.1 hypothetical protein [Nocardia puris]
MTDNLSVELELLDRASTAWSQTVYQALYKAAGQIDPLKLSQEQFGIYQIPWEEYIQTASYLQERLREGGAESSEMASGLRIVAATYRGQDEQNEDDLKRLEVDFNI